MTNPSIMICCFLLLPFKIKIPSFGCHDLEYVIIPSATCLVIVTFRVAGSAFLPLDWNNNTELICIFYFKIGRLPYLNALHLATFFNTTVQKSIIRMTNQCALVLLELGLAAFDEKYNVI